MKTEETPENNPQRNGLAQQPRRWEYPRKRRRYLLLGCLIGPCVPLLVILILMVLFLVHGCSPPSALPHLLDEDGRIVLYHGVNVSNYSKYAPDFLPWHTREDFAQLQDWGFNLARYLVFWEAIEPEDGCFDEAYLAATLERIGWLGELGIDALVDLHQDLYARRERSCCVIMSPYIRNALPDAISKPGTKTTNTLFQLPCQLTTFFGLNGFDAQDNNPAQ